jgi:hypothetical protein
MKFPVAIAISAVITLCSSISASASPISAMQDRTDYGTKLELLDRICAMSREGRSYEDILALGSTFYLQHGNIDSIAPDEPYAASARIYRQRLAEIAVLSAMDVASDSDSCR